MKTSLIKKLLVGILPIALIITLTIDNLNSKPGGKAGYTGSFKGAATSGEATCAGCHGDYIVNLPNGYIRMNGTLLTTLRYTPGNTYNLTVTVTRTGSTLFGFGLEAIFTNGSNAGTLTPVGSDTQNALIAANGRINLTHTGVGNTTTNTHTFSFTWTAPPSGAGDVYFFMSGAACNNNGGSGGDYVYTKRYLVKP